MATEQDDIEIEEFGVSEDERRKRRVVLEKTKGQDLVRDWGQRDRSELDQKMKAHAPPTVIEQRCHVCISPHRPWIEMLLVKGYGYKAISEKVPADEDGHKPDRRSISRHYKEHMAIEKMVIREELMREAESLRTNAEEGGRDAFTDRGALRVLIRKTFDDAMAGVINSEVKDLIQMVKLLNDIEVDASETKTEEAEMQLRIFGRAIENVLDQDQRFTFVEEVKRLRAMSDIDFEIEAQFKYEPAKVVDGEIVDDEKTLPSGSE
jgi:hypothetical protein